MSEKNGKKKQTRRKIQKKRLTGSKVTIKDFHWKDVRPVISLLIFCAILITALIAYKFQRNKTEQENLRDYKAQNIEKSRSVIKKEPVEITSYILMEGDVKGAANISDQFLMSKSAAEAKVWVGEDSELFRRIYKETPRVISKKCTTALEYKDGSRLVVYHLDYKGGASEIQLFAEPEKPFKVDWRSYFMCGSIPFREYVETIPSKIHDTFCYLLMDYYYSSKFPEEEYQSVLLRDYDGRSRISGYVKRDTYMDGDLASALLASDLKLNGKKAIRVHLTIELGKNMTRPAVNILDVNAVDWISHLRGEKALR